jgi:hypothetical protein
MNSEMTTGFRMSPQQRFVWGLREGGQDFVAQCAVRIEGPLSKEVLERALQHVIERHENLRTTFHRPAGMRIPLQVIQATAPATLADLDLRGSSPAEVDAAVDELLARERQQPFAHDRGPLLRATLLTQSANCHMLLLTLPSLLADRQTLKNLVTEVSRICMGECSEGVLAEEPLQYADFSEWQNELFEAVGDEAETAKAFWRRQDLGAAPALSLPFQQRSRMAASSDIAREPCMGWQKQPTSSTLRSRTFCSRRGRPCSGASRGNGISS